MKKLKFTVFLVVALVIAVTGLASYSINSYKKMNGQYRIIKAGEQSLVLPKLSQEDKKDIANKVRNEVIVNRSLSEVIENNKNSELKNSIALDLDMKNEKIELKNIQFDEGSFDVYKVKKEETEFLFPKEMTNILLQQTKNKEQYVFVSDSGSIYLYDNKKSDCSKLIHDVSNGYDKNELAKSYTEGGELLAWAVTPVMNDEISLLAYGSNRRTYLTKNSIVRDIWLYDLYSKEDFLLVEKAYPLAWNSNFLYYCDYNDSIFKIDILTKETERILPSAAKYFIDGNYIVFTEKLVDSNLLLYNYRNNTLLKLSSSNPDYIIDFALNSNTEQSKFQASVTKYINNKYIDTYLMIIDINKKAVNLYDGIYDGAEGFTNDGWYDSSNVLITLYYDGMRRSESQMINIDNLNSIDAPIKLTVLEGGAF
jgi:hypothetical protein